MRITITACRSAAVILTYIFILWPFCGNSEEFNAENKLPALGSTEENLERFHQDQKWGIAIGLRHADIPFTADDESVEDVLPLMFFENDRFFLRGIEGGIKLHETHDWRFNLLGRYRFFDIPERFQNEVRGSGIDFGLQVEREYGSALTLSLEAMSDTDGRTYANARIGSLLGGGKWSLRPSLGLRMKSSRFNNRYYGLGVASPGSGVDFDARVQGRYHLWRELYLIGSVGGRYLGSEVQNLPFIEDRWSWELFAGIAFFNQPDASHKPVLPDKAYVRVAHGWATPSNLGEIISGETEKDPYNNQLTSLFYGHPLADSLLGLPLDIYLTPGLIFHHSS